MLLSEGQMSDYKGAALMLDALPRAKTCLAKPPCNKVARLVRKHRVDDIPFIVAEFIPHDSKPQYGSLNHALGATINSEPAFPESPPNRTCCGHAKIGAIDPKPTFGSSQMQLRRMRRCGAA